MSLSSVAVGRHHGRFRALLDPVDVKQRSEKRHAPFVLTNESL
jgi:hypothetical protein